LFWNLLLVYFPYSHSLKEQSLESKQMAHLIE
jgi:hypothetical protein